jgi:hypothetical protein
MKIYCNPFVDRGPFPSISCIALNNPISFSSYLFLSVALQVTGGAWSMVEHLHRVSFSAERTPRIEMLDGKDK